MRVFVTGSTGLLGNNLVHTLLEQGHEVRALARSKEKATKVLGTTAAEIIVSDLENVTGFADALDGIEVLYNTAAYFSEYYGKTDGDHWTALKRVNIDATLELFAAAESHGVKRIVHTSSSGTIGRRADRQPADETTPPDELAAANLYFRSKVMGDQAIAQFGKTHRIEIMTIKPTLILGPRDVGPTAFGEFLTTILSGTTPAIPAGGATVVDARDVADGMIRAAARGKAGEHYLMSKGYISTPEIARVLTDLIGRRPYPTMPHPVGMTMAFFSEIGARFTGGKPLVTRQALQTFQGRYEVTSAKAQRELGATFRPVEESLRDEAQWFIAHGYVKGKVQVLSPARTT